jgi:transcriptional regulator with XRE-family HTH domain
MSRAFAETIKQLRTEKDLSQAQLAELIFVTRSTIARWENGSRMPDSVMISRLAKCLGVDAGRLFSLLSEEEETHNIIMLDDESIILSGGLPVLEEVFPDAIITGFTKPSEAIEYARSNQVSLAFLDIEMGPVNGLEICRKLQQINSKTNVIFLTAYPDYSLNAWDTGATGFLLKPVTAEGIRKQLERLKYPVSGGTAAT